MMGVGGGTIMVPAMVLLAGFSQHTAQGTSLLAMIPAGGVGAFTHWKLGNVRVDLLAGLIPGILIGTYLGGTLAHVLSEATLRIVFAVILIWTGARYLRTPAGNSVQRSQQLQSIIFPDYGLIVYGKFAPEDNDQCPLDCSGC